MASPSPERTPWLSSIVTRSTLAFALLLLVALAATGWIGYRASRDQVLYEARTDLRHTLDVAATRMTSFAHTLEEDVDQLAGSDAVHAYTVQVDTLDTVQRAIALDEVARLMGPFIRSRALYAQVRLLAADSAGNELVRFDRTGDLVQRIPDSLLQAKADRDYYRLTMALPRDGRYFSPIDLNRERGVIARPFMPTLRASAPLFSPRGGRAGMVIINTDMRPFFAELSALADSGRMLLLANAQDQLLLHPDTARAFRYELGGSSTLTDALRTGDLLTATRTVEIGPAHDRYMLAIARPMDAVLHDLIAKRDRIIRVVGLIAAASVLLVLLFALGLRRRMEQLTLRMERYAVGERADLPVQRGDEIGRMARGLARMQERIDARVKELETARAQAETSDRQRRDLLANMSHEVRTPLNAIMGMSADLDVERLTEADREKVAIVRRNAERLRGLVDDLLLHARIGEGRMRVQLANVDVRTLVQDIARAHQPDAMAKGIALRTHLDSLPARVLCDGLRLHQIIDNLVGNAVRFTRQGQVDVTVHRNEEGLRLVVADTGPGIPAEEQQRVFERFERASGDAEAPGAGLGLAITERVVELLGGRLTLESKPGEGARFTVVLPTAGSPVAAPAPESKAAADMAGLRVVYVEDVATNRLLMEQWAGAWRWELQLATDAAAALALADKMRPDLWLIDLGLGQGMNGVELALRLRGLKKHRYVPMIAVTAYAEEGEDADALKAGMNDRITKPIDRAALELACAFWSGKADLEEERPELTAVSAAFDGDPEKLLKVYQQYRKEFTQRRLELRAAVAAGDANALHEVRHQLRPHWQQLHLPRAVAQLEALTADGAPSLPMRLENVFRACDRAFMRAQQAILGQA